MKDLESSQPSNASDENPVWSSNSHRHISFHNNQQYIFVRSSIQSKCGPSQPCRKSLSSTVNKSFKCLDSLRI